MTTMFTVFSLIKNQLKLWNDCNVNHGKWITDLETSSLKKVLLKFVEFDHEMEKLLNANLSKSCFESLLNENHENVKLITCQSQKVMFSKSTESKSWKCETDNLPISKSISLKVYWI